MAWNKFCGHKFEEMCYKIYGRPNVSISLKADWSDKSLFSTVGIVGIIKLAGFVEALAEGNKLSTLAFLSDFPCDTFICFRGVGAQISY